MPIAAEFDRLPRELKLAAIAAVCLIASLFLPWYQKSFFTTIDKKPIAATENLSALQVFSFIEGAILVIALAILCLIWVRMKQRAFSLPGSDGIMIMITGCWTTVLLIWRIFDRPSAGGHGMTIGIQWGIFVALIAAVSIIVLGQRLRNAGSLVTEDSEIADDDEMPTPAPQNSTHKPDNRKTE